MGLPLENRSNPSSQRQSFFLASSTILALVVFSWLLQAGYESAALVWIGLLAVASVQQLIIHHYNQPQRYPHLVRISSTPLFLSYLTLAALWGSLPFTINSQPTQEAVAFSLLISLGALSLLILHKQQSTTQTALLLCAGLLPTISWLTLNPQLPNTALTLAIFIFAISMIFAKQTATQTKFTPKSEVIPISSSGELKKEAQRENIAIINAIPDLIFKINTSGDVLWHNLAYEKIILRHSNNIENKNIFNLFSRKEQVHLQSAIERSTMIGKTRYDTVIQVGNDIIPYNLSLVSSRNSEGKLDAFVCVGRNISERLAAEKERSSLLLKLQQAQKMESIGHLTGGIAHDFNNILASILGFTQLAIGRGKKYNDEKLEHYHNQINEGGIRAKELISQLLSFSRKQVRELEEVNISKLLVEIVEMLRPLIPSSINIHYDVEETPYIVKTNPIQFHQVIMNLCINARDAMDGKGQLSIKLARVRHQGGYCQACHTPFGGDYIELSICDTGHGIKKEFLEHIFEPFTTSKEVGKGTGMGLATVHGIIHDHNGHISVQSEYGKGSSFFLYFPIAEAATLGTTETLRQAS